MQVRLTIENSSRTRKYGSRINVPATGHLSYNSAIAKFLFVTAGVVFTSGAQAQTTTEPVQRDIRLWQHQQTTTEPVQRDMRLSPMEKRQHQQTTTKPAVGPEVMERPDKINESGLKMREEQTRQGVRVQGESMLGQSQQEIRGIGR